MTTRISLFFTEENNNISEWIKEQAKLTNNSINNYIVELLKKARHEYEYKKESSISKEVQLDSTEIRSTSDSKESS